MSAAPPRKVREASSAGDRAPRAPERARQLAPDAGRPGADNLALQSLYRSGALRAKLVVGGTDDPAEVEADRIADQVMRGGPVCAGTCGPTPCPVCRAKGILSRKATGSRRGPASLAGNLGLGSGRPIGTSERSFFESRMRAEFSRVQVHDDDRAGRAAEQLNARAFTVGNDIAFARGAYAPHTEGGRALLAHELVHVIQNDGVVRRAPNTSSMDDVASNMPPPEPQVSSLYGPAKAVHAADFNPCAVDVRSFSNYELLAELNTTLEHVEAGEDSEGYFDWRNLGRRLEAERSRRARIGHIWLQAATGEIPATLVRVSDNLIDGSMTVTRVSGSSDAFAGDDIHLEPLMTEAQFQAFLDRQQLETIRLEEYRRQMLEARMAQMTSAGVAGTRLYNTGLDANLIDPFARRPGTNTWMGRLGEAGYEGSARAGFGWGVDDLNGRRWTDSRGRLMGGGNSENYPVFDFENKPSFARVLGVARVSVKTSAGGTAAQRFDYYNKGLAEMYQSGAKSALPSYIDSQPQFAGQGRTGPQYEANRSQVLADAYIAVNADDVSAFRSMLSDPSARESATSPTLWEDAGGFTPGQRFPRAGWRPVYEGVMREHPVRVNGVDYSTPAALDQAHRTGQITTQDYRLAQGEVGRRAASKVVSHGVSTTDLVNLRSARPTLSAIPEARLPSLLTPEYMRATRLGGGLSGEFGAAGGAGLKGGGAGGVIAVITTAGVMFFDEPDHPDWERELGTAGALGTFGGFVGSGTEQLLISGGTRIMLNSAAEGVPSMLTPRLTTLGGRFGGGGAAAGALEMVSMGFLEDRKHSDLEWTERTTRAFVIGGGSAVIGAEVGTSAGVFTTALIGAAAGSEVPIVGNIVGFIVGLGVGAFIYYEADKVIPGGRADWDAAEAARQEGCKPIPARPTLPEPKEHMIYCFRRGTLVTMADGSTTAIEDVQPGDWVLGLDVVEARTVPARVTKAIHHGRAPCLGVRLADGSTLRVTANHPVATLVDARLRWAEAGALVVGQYVLVAAGVGEIPAMQAIVAVDAAVQDDDVFDLTVEKVHNFFAERVLVHNKNI
jgi:hypothetical protein